MNKITNMTKRLVLAVTILTMGSFALGNGSGPSAVDNKSGSAAGFYGGTGLEYQVGVLKQGAANMNNRENNWRDREDHDRRGFGY